MWYVSTRNGGQYWKVRNERPASAELNKVLEDLTASGKKFRVYYNEYEYSGYSGDVELINDDTLNTIYVHHHISFGWDGDAYWKVCIIDEDYNEVEVFNSKYGRTSDLIASIFEAIKEESSVLLLPAPRKKTWREEMAEEQERMRRIRQSTKTTRIEWDGDEICF